MVFEELTPNEKITRAKIQLGYSHPFWAYLVLHGKYVEDTNIETLSVNQTGRILYNPEFIKSLTEAEIRGVIVHEIFHVAFEHLNRLQDFSKKDAKIWNVSADIVVNNELLKDNLILPKNGLLPMHDKIKINDKIIEDISKKSVEQIYSELYDENLETTKTIDEHEYTEDGSTELKRSNNNNTEASNNNSAEGTQDIQDDNGSLTEKDWTEILTEAAILSKQQGTLPSGVERLLGKLLNPEIDWRNKLYKYITNELPFDYTYTRPSKKSLASGVYLPSAKKEKLSVVVGVDVSGSITQKEFTKYITEILSLSKTFVGLDMTLITWNTDVKKIIKIENGNIEEIEKIRTEGGGGTDINVYFKKINELSNVRLVVTLTDGYFGDITENVNAQKIWVLTSKNSTTRKIKDGEIIIMESLAE